MNAPLGNLDPATFETPSATAPSFARANDGGTVAAAPSPANLPVRRPYLNRELSWLAFNDRVLEEANDPSVPILERVKFLAIYASNLDEFFMVRVAALRRQIEAGIKTPGPDGLAPTQAMRLISARVHQSHERIGQCLREKILPELAVAGIFLLDEKSVSAEQRAYLVKYFNKSLRAMMTPLAIDPAHPFPRLENKALYFCVELARKKKPANKPRTRLVLLQIPTPLFGRFVRLPSPGDTMAFIRLDDVIRLHLAALFPGDVLMGCYEIKVVRDAELAFDEEAPDLLESIAKTLEQRRTAPATRFLHDAEMPKRVLDMFCHQLKLAPADMFPGARYHSFSDFSNFPASISRACNIRPCRPNPFRRWKNTNPFLPRSAGRSSLHHPYQKFDYVVRLLEEAANDTESFRLK
jgi:polyphosphate kinase